MQLHINNITNGLKSLLKLVPVMLSVWAPAMAGVAVSALAGKTTWDGEPLVATYSGDPLSVGSPANKGFYSNMLAIPADGGCFAESFTVPAGSDCTLQAIATWLNKGNNGPLLLCLYDLGMVTSPSSSSAPVYAPANATNLLGDGVGLPVSGYGRFLGSSGGSIIKFNLSGKDQVALVAGHTYVFEMRTTTSTSGPQVYRSGVDLYSGGTAYSVAGGSKDSTIRNLVNNGTRDIGLAVYAKKRQ
jgi:hypothetical protein